VPHEAGHHVQCDLEADQALVQRVGDLLDRHGDATWQAWRFEVFADVFAVAAIGPESVHVIAELEWDELDHMATNRGTYPPVIVRLAIAAEVAVALGYPASGFVVDRWRPQLASVTSEPTRAAVSDALERVIGAPGKPGLAAELADLVVGSVAVRDIPGRTVAADLDETLSGDAAARREVLGGKDRVIQPGRRESRLAAAAAFREYRERAAPADDQRDVADDKLRRRTLTLFDQVRDTTSKRGPAPTAARGDLAVSVLDRAKAAREEEGW
jgi:hypothetical protein